MSWNEECIPWNYRQRKDEATKGIPVIAVTGNTFHDDRQRMIASGFNDIITKPYKIDDLLKVIGKRLGAPNGFETALLS